MSGVAKSYATPRGPLPVLREVDFAVRAGEFVAVTGPSGSGKTTLLNLAALLDTPTSGTVRFDGEDVSRLGEDALADVRKRKIGMVFQNFHLLPHRSALDNVLFRFRYLAAGRDEAAAQAAAALAAVGLERVAWQPARLLSGGEMQRVAIARAVALTPRLLVADEPTGNLDHHAAEAVMNTFVDLNQRGISVLLVTHNEALLKYCSRHFVCEDGRLAEHA
ncbi:MAG: ABC transporter ATP-binding protein [Kiritimatiellae bacterium]|nr:ABC transporter ATP-binding protein [Kiritimatiellia bacterium]